MALPMTEKLPMTGTPDPTALFANRFGALERPENGIGPVNRLKELMFNWYGHPNQGADQIMQGFPTQNWNAAALGGGVGAGNELSSIWAMNPRALTRTAGKPGPLGGAGQ